MAVFVLVEADLAASTAPELVEDMSTDGLGLGWGGWWWPDRSVWRCVF